MADFQKYYAVLERFEGKYSNDPDDRGGETYKGIARNMDSDWSGWSIVDSYRSKPGFPKNLDLDEELQKLVQLYYKRKYWDIFHLDYASNELAWELLDIGVNMGVGRAIQFMQEIFNSLNNKGTRWVDVSVDSSLGRKTNSAWNSFKLECRRRGHDPDLVLSRLLNIKQGSFYFEIMERNESQEKYAWGWFSRVIDFS